MLQLLVIPAAIMERTDTGRDLCGPEWLAIHIATSSALVPKENAVAAINPANGGMFPVGHIFSPSLQTRSRML
jgi:hypothetical protein